MPDWKASPTLTDLQNYVSQMEAERGFEHQSVQDKCLLLGEETGELFKAVRKAQGIATDPESHVGEVGDELADVLIYLCAIANRCGVDLEEALRLKEVKNHARRWS